MPGKIFLAVPGGGSSYAYTPADVAGSTGPLTVLGGTLTGASTPVLNLTQTWNNAATTFTGELINITDTASAAGSMLIDCKVGGTSFFNVTKAGKLNIGQRGGGIDTSTDYYTKLTGYFGDLIGQTSSGSTYLPASIFFTSALDAGLSREGAGILGQRTGVVAQAFRVYNTYTDASNYERSAMYWSANQLYIGSEKAGTGTARTVNIGSNPAGAPDAQLNLQGTTIRLYATSSYLGLDSSSNPFPGVTTGTLGISASPWNGIYLSKTITAAGTTGAQTINKASGSVNFAAAATSLVVTNSLVTTSSVIIATVGTNDTTMKTVSAVAAAGSFTLFANAAATAETRVNFIITN